MGNNIKINTLYNTIKSACSILFPIITFPYISRTLMAEGVGKVNFGNSIVSYFTLIASLGVATYALKECSRNRDSRENLSKVASEIFSINLFSTVIAYIALFITLTYADKLENYRTLIIIQSSVILFTTLGTDWINSAMEDFKFISLRTVFFQVLSVVLMFIFINDPDDYIKYAIISVVASSGANIVNIIYRRKYCKIRFTIKMNIRKHLPPIVLFFSLILAQQIFVNSDTTILGIFKGDYEVGLYSTSVKIYTIVNTIIASVSTVVWPQIAEAYKNNRQDDVNRLAKYSLGFILTFGLPAIVGINVITKEIILIISGKEYIAASTSLHILTIALFFSFLGGWASSTNFLPNGKEKICLFASSCAALINITMNLILIPKWGLNAAAFTTGLSEFVSICVLIVKYDRKQKIEGLSEMLKGPLIGCGFIVLASYCIRLITSNYILISVCTISVSVVGYVIILLLVKNSFFMGYMKPIVNKLKRRT